MTPNNEDNRTEGTLERILDAIGSDIAGIATMTQGMYERLGCLSEQTQDIYDMLAYQKDIPVFDPDEYVAA